MMGRRRLARRIGVVLLPLLVNGCAVAPPQEATAPPAGAPGAPGASARPSDGNYYLDDGPPDEPSIALADIPDAEVRVEKINPAHNRPYVVLNKRYVPFRELRPYKKRGMASWYGKRYHGRQTASGEIYDMFQMTAAHPILPIPSYVRVTRVDSGVSVVVRINDRGPFLQGREIDLSYVAAAKLGIVQSGTGEVIVEALIPAQMPVGRGDAGGTIEDSIPLGDEVYVQLAAFSNAASAQEEAAALRRQLPDSISGKISVYKKAGDIYAVQVGPYPDHAQATRADEEICGRYRQCGFLTKRYR